MIRRLVLVLFVLLLFIAGLVLTFGLGMLFLSTRPKLDPQLHSSSVPESSLRDAPDYTAILQKSGWHESAARAVADLNAEWWQI